MKNKNWTLPLFIMGALLMLTNCKKDDETKKDTVITWATPADITYGTLLSATQLNATADVPGTFVYTPAIGTKLEIGANQELKVVFTPTDAAKNNAATKTVKINVVAKKVPVITWATPADISYGTLLSATQLNATADVPGTFVYTPAIGTKLIAGAIHDLKVDFTPTDAANYNTVSKTVKINVVAVTDADGNVYQTVTIGTQTWMAENLRTTKYNDGTSIPNVTSASAWDNLTTGAYSNYNNTTNNDTIATYGRLYNWYTISTGKLAPTGWHVATDAEWTTLTTYLGGISGAGGKLKETGTTHWISPNTGATNESGFIALPGGYRGFNGGFTAIGSSGNWWSATEQSTILVWAWGMSYEYSVVSKYNVEKKIGFSVRCIKD